VSDETYLKLDLSRSHDRKVVMLEDILVEVEDDVDVDGMSMTSKGI
jgi:ribosomal protein L6P/L9E